MNTTRILTAIVAAGILAITPATANASGGENIRYLSTNPQNTDIDLAAPGPSPGDQQAFVGDAVRNGTRIGYETGVCQLTLLTDTRLIGHCHVTVVLTAGTLTAQGAFEENPQQGPVGYTWAITGGTGRYAGRGGELTGTFIPNTNNVNVTIRLR